ncbi:MAG: hypothetical protein ACM3S1_16855 [Hyphomicrobiales bacterium]
METFSACVWEVASFDSERFARAEQAAESHTPQHDALLLATCQRLEAYRFEPCSCDSPVKLRGREALYHLADVAAGLLAAVPGEDQVLGQVRSSLASAPPVFRALGDVALASARQLRRELGLEADAGHVLDSALATLGAQPKGTMLVLGSGHMGRLVARRGLALGFDRVLVGARQRPSASWFVDPRLSWVPLDSVASLEPVQLVAGCLAAGAGELSPASDLPRANYLVDLGTPRNFAPGDIPGVTIAGLLAIEDPETAGWRRRQSERLHAIVDARLALPETNHRSGVRQLRSEVEAIRQAEVERSAALHRDIDPAVIDQITKSLVNRLFHAPTERLRELGDDGFARQFAELFAPGPDLPDSEEEL